MDQETKGLKIATFAGGCFWCSEADLEKLPGVAKVISGYTGGHKDNPSYDGRALARRARGPGPAGRDPGDAARGRGRRLRPGGALVFSTCTVLHEENEAVVADFLSRVPGFRRAAVAELPAALGPLLDAEATLRTWPHRHGTDGFFAVRLVREAP